MMSAGKLIFGKSVQMHLFRGHEFFAGTNMNRLEYSQLPY